MSEVDPRMHTAEHMLNQAMDRQFGCGRCFSAHINNKKSKLDYNFNKEISEEEIRLVEKNVNEIIAKKLEVNEEVVEFFEAEKIFDLHRIPDEKKTEKIRIIRVGDYDACPCAGKHVSNTEEIGKLKITTFSLEDNILRLRYKLESD